MLYFSEKKSKKWKQQEITLGPRPTIKDAKPYETKSQEQEQDYDSLDELEREILGDDEQGDKELANIHQKRKQQLKKEWKQKQEEMAQVYPCTHCTF